MTSPISEGVTPEKRTLTDPISEGVTARLRAYFLKYPNSKPRTACRAVGLDPYKYGQSARVIKHQVKRLISGGNH